MPLDAEMFDAEEKATASLAEARALGADNGVEVNGRTVRARSIGDAIVDAAAESGADLIVLGSAPRWRRQSRFFSPTVDYVLRKSPREVLIVAFPQGSLEEDDDLVDTPWDRATLRTDMKALVIGCGRVGLDDRPPAQPRGAGT